MNGVVVRSVFAKAGKWMGGQGARLLMALALVLGSVGMAPAWAGLPTTGVNVGDFVKQFNETSRQMGYDNMIDTTFVQDTGGENVLLTGKLGNYATLIGTVSRDNREMIGVIVMMNAQGKEAVAEGAVMAYAAMSAAAPGTTVQMVADQLQEEFNKGNQQKTFGKVTVKAQDMGKLGLMYSAGVEVAEKKVTPLNLSSKEYINGFNAAMKASGNALRLDAKGIKKGERYDALQTELGTEVAFLGTFSKDDTKVVNLVFLTQTDTSSKEMDEVYRIASTGIAVVTPGVDSKKLDATLRKMKSGEKVTVGQVRLSRTENDLGLMLAAESALN